MRRVNPRLRAMLKLKGTPQWEERERERERVEHSTTEITQSFLNL
jgi:hypothetical protein